MKRALPATVLLLCFCVAVSLAQPPAPPESIHPTFPLLDENGTHVLESGGPVSALWTCGQCHDTAYIESHSYHADAGLRESTAAGRVPGGRPWDISTGIFGRWNPLTYQVVALPDSGRPSPETAAWIRANSVRHVGGGPAMHDRDGRLLTDLEPDGTWDWKESGVVEMNCFLCHLSNPNNEARLATIRAGRFRWASMATISGKRIATETPEGWAWNPEAFDHFGHVRSDLLPIQEPADENCGQCHGLVSEDPMLPLNLTACEHTAWSTITTGQIFSPQRLSDSGMNLAGKVTLSRAWDVHAERLVSCIDCHHSLNNPAYCEETSTSRPEHLRVKGRNIAISEYLRRPSHEFAKGQSVQGILAKELDASMRRCESCHSSDAGHDWLPYKRRHLSIVGCESCHITRIHGPTHNQIDWTVITPGNEPRILCRGIEGEYPPPTPDRLISGYAPILLQRREADGSSRIVPHNLIGAWFWVAGDPELPVGVDLLRDAYLEGEVYRSDVVTALDEDGDGTVEQAELRLDTPAKVDLIRRRLEDLGAAEPRIVGEVQPFSIHHTVARGTAVTRDCRTCHGRDSRLTEPFLLAIYVPGGVVPQLVRDANVVLTGEPNIGDDGSLVFSADTKSAGLYVLGHDRAGWADGIGLVAILGVLLGALVHAGLRFRENRRRRDDGEHRTTSQRVYMFTAYERFWHWLQALAILALVLTGLEIHSPDGFSFFGFRIAVSIHSTIGIIVVINAILAAFYHLASGEIRQYIPEPKGFFGSAIQQARYYVRGVFLNERHPFERIPEKKLNPLQQVTYLMILNVLLPLQVLTGLAMWGAQHRPNLAASLGGLTVLAPLHGLIAWVFAAFLLLHIYLTTIGRTPTANIKAMIAGWEEVEGGTAR